MDISKRIYSLIFDKYNFTEFQLDDMDEIDDINIFDNLGFDSIQFIELIVELEAEFEIEIEDNMFLTENFSTIGQIIEIVKERVG